MCNLYSKSGMFQKSRDDRPMIWFVLFFSQGGERFRVDQASFENEMGPTTVSLVMHKPAFLLYSTCILSVVSLQCSLDFNAFSV